MNNHYLDVVSYGSRLASGFDCPACPEAEAALRGLMQGNALYLSHARNPAHLTDLIRSETAHKGQHPYAVVVCCADSRVPPEHIFSAGIGDLFVIRNAGNVMTPAALASVEYAVGHLHVPLVLVMGHRGCGAVAAAMMKERDGGALGELIAQVAEAVGHAHNPREAERKNLRASVQRLGDSSLLCSLFASGKAAAAAGMYDIRSGSVALLTDEEPD